MTWDYPLLFTPWLRNMPWGGSDLEKIYNADTTGEAIGEAWLLSDHSLQHSIVSNGIHAGRTIHELLAIDSFNLLGRSGVTTFPLLIKILDTQSNLSVQVHPDDEKAKTWAPSEGGKSEAWVILKSHAESKIYLDTQPQIGMVQVKEAVESGTLLECMRVYQSASGQTYSVPAGSIHAIGTGIMALEVQQTSNATFRLYDWGRVGPDGTPRSLHIEAGLACLAFDHAAGLQSEKNQPDGSIELVKTPYFTISKWCNVPVVTVQSPSIIIPWNGSAHIAQQYEVLPGRACLLPHGMKEVSVELPATTTLFEITW